MSVPKKASSATKPLTSVMEDYLEAIFDLDKDKKVVRVKDIAKRMNVKMPTVSSMLKTLSARGLVNYEKYEYVELTSEGAKVGGEMRRRHEILRQFLTDILDIKPKVADEEACMMEHALCTHTLNRLADFMEFIQICPRTGDSWLQFFEEYRKHGHRPEMCQARSADFSCEFQSQTGETEKSSN